MKIFGVSDRYKNTTFSLIHSYVFIVLSSPWVFVRSLVFLCCVSWISFWIIKTKIITHLLSRVSFPQHTGQFIFL